MPRFNAWKRLSATDGVCVRVTNIGHVISHLRYSARHHEIQEGLQETRTGCLCVSVCVCVDSRVLQVLPKEVREREGTLSVEIILALLHPSMLNICVCVLHERMYEQHVCVTTAACVCPTVGETSCRAWQHSRRQHTPFDTAACVGISINVCVRAPMCVLTGFTIRQSILSSPRNSWAGRDPEKRQRNSKKFSLTFMYGIKGANWLYTTKMRHQKT